MEKLKKNFKKYKWHYLFILPGIILLFLFAYMPMYGAVIAFKEYRIYKGIWESPWVGWLNFNFLYDSYFWHTLKNTFYITIFRLIFGFPAPIILALMLNEVRNKKYKKTVQTLSYLPHFVSYIVVAYILYSLLALDTGIVNNLLDKIGFSQIFFMGESKWFRPIVIISGMWKEIGWGSIIYLAALANVNPQLHEAATIDGAGRFARIWYINIPTLLPTISILLILSMPGLLTAGYRQIYPLINPSNMEVSDVLDVYIIRLGLTQAQYSIATAIGLVLSIAKLFLVLLCNYISKKVGGVGFW